jgi:hypothetical protein
VKSDLHCELTLPKRSDIQRFISSRAMSVAFLGIAGSAGTLNKKDVVETKSGTKAYGKQPSKVKPPKEGKGNLGDKVKQDINAWEHFLKFDSGKKLIENGEKQPKSMVVKEIQDFFNGGHKKYFLVYSGHGDGNGDWCFEDSNGKWVETLSLAEIADMFSKRKNKVAAQVWIVCDCCCSGAWAYEQNEKKHGGICIWAACDKTQKAFIGVQYSNFTAEVIQRQLMHVCSQVKAYQTITDDQHPQTCLYQGVGKTVLFGHGNKYMCES